MSSARIYELMAFHPLPIQPFYFAFAERLTRVFGQSDGCSAARRTQTVRSHVPR